MGTGSRTRRLAAGLLIAIAAGGALVGAQRSTVDVRVVEAAKTGDTTVLRALVRQRADVNAESDGFTPLLWASYRSSHDTARLLLSAGADANKANRLGMTPLLLASRIGDAEMIDLLLSAGANAKAVHHEGETALMAAAGAGSVRGIQRLLKAGAAVDAKDRVQQQTALMWAASDGHLAAVSTLLDAGADVNAVAKVSTLSHEEDGSGGRIWPDFPSGGLTALMFAARQGHADVAALLADRGAALATTNADGLSAVTIAILNDRVDLAAMLLDKGAPADVAALYEAVRLHNLGASEPVPTGTNSVARPWPSHDNRLTPLDLIARLVSQGADPNQLATHTLHIEGTHRAEPVNDTPLGRALAAQDVAGVRLLLGKGASPNARNADRATLLHVIAAAGGGGRGAAPSAFRFSAERSAVSVARALLESGGDVQATTPAGDTPLHLAAQGGNVEMIRLLAAAGARLDAQNTSGFTPLDLASGRQPAGRGAAGGARAGGRGGRGGAAQPQPQAIAALRSLMGLPVEAEPPAPGRPAGGGNQP